MSKLVTLKISQGTVGDGYAVTLRIEDQLATTKGVFHQPKLERDGMLPCASEVFQAYTRWQQSYRGLDLRYRLEAIAGQLTQISQADLIAECEQTASQFQQCFDHWLKADSFRVIRETLLGHVPVSEATRFILQIEDTTLQRLPWEQGDLFTQYHQADIVLASPTYGQVATSTHPNATVNILAILGNSSGINVDRDRALLEKLPNATVKLLVEPSLDDLSDQLWQQPWDILFFAGHSSSQDCNGTGRIFINRTESLTLDKLKYSLRHAIAQGLKIAIFNSCDGLGLARSLADLQIPQVVVMREPVPDRVAHAFLKTFLDRFSQGDSFYQSVRKAREKLQVLETEFPCATWLPVVYQNLTTIAPTWNDLVKHVHQKKHHLSVALFSSVLTTTAILAARFAGLLQPLELSMYDQVLRSRPAEKIDDRIVVVKVTEADVEQQVNQTGSSLSDRTLNELLDKVLKHQPKAIGIDIYLDHPIKPTYKTLQNALKSGQLTTVCKAADPTRIERPEIKPPQGSTSYGFSDSVSDDNDIMRRQLLAMDAQPGRCDTEDSLSLSLALNYLKSRNIELETDAEWQLGKATLPVLTNHTGGYQQFDDGGYQLLVNYRSSGSLQEAFPSVSLGQILTLPDEQLETLVRDRLILIGTTAPSFHDIAKTPYHATQSDDRCSDPSPYQCAPGVFIQAQMTSQLISAALGERPLLWALPFWIDGLLVLASSISGAFLAWKVQKNWILIVLTGGAIVAIWGASVMLLITPGCWVPLVPMLAGLILAGSLVKGYSIHQSTQPLIAGLQ